VASRDRQRGRLAAKELGAQAGGAVDDLLAESVDAIIVSSASGDHPADLQACLGLGAPVLCEKPIALTVEESRQAVDAAERAGVTLQAGFQRRFDAGFVEARRRIASGELGNLYSIRLVSHDRTPPSADSLTGKGSIFRDLHVHDFDLARWLTGAEVDEVVAVSATRTEFTYLTKQGDADTTAILLRMTNGVIVTITGSRHNPAGHDVRAELFGSQDSIAVGFDTHTALTAVGTDPLHWDTSIRYGDFLDRFRAAFADETRAFLDVASGLAPNPCPGAEAVEALRIALAAEESDRTGRPIRPTDVKSHDAD
jgi:myo-inositol 2-dehydrogenase/D-chiro-inositol 1-dehydrogenase